MKEQTLPATEATINVDGKMNGGISIKGWERNEILMRARVQSAAPTEAAAKELASQVKIETAGSQIFASGPENTQGPMVERQLRDFCAAAFERLFENNERRHFDY